MELNFFLYNLQKTFSKNSCRKIVEKTAQTELTNNKIRLNHDGNGKPYLVYDERHVSYSHTDDSLFIAFSESPIGVDFERKGRSRELENMREYAFSGKDSVPDDINLLELWCLKEASLKKKGIGFLFANPNEYTLTADRQNYELRNGDEIIDEGFYKIIKKDQYVFAICSMTDITNYKIIKENYKDVYSRI